MAGPKRTKVQRARSGSFGDRTRSRTVLLNQVLLAGVVMVVALIALVSLFPGNTSLFLAGVLVVFFATAAAVAVPWNSIPAWVSALVPMLDILAITAIRESSPPSGFELLWIFPAMWLAGSFGLPGLFGGVSVVCALYLVPALAPDRDVTIATVILPFTIVALATTSYLTTHRSHVQRRLLDSQTGLLSTALARARQQEETLTEVLEAVDFGIIRIGVDGRVSLRNEAHGRLQSAGGATPDEELPAYARDGITRLSADDEPLARALRGETFDDAVVWFGEPGAPRRALTVTARRVHDDDGTDAGSVIVSRDITAELSAIRAREDLVASVSHELRTPLTSIVGYLDLVLDEDLSPTARRGLEVAERNAHRLLSIVSDILATTAADRSTIELSYQPEQTDLADLVASAVELHIPRAAERGIRFDTSGVESATAYVDPSRIRQVLDNLLSNAVKYNRADGSIAVGTTVDADHAWIVVRDSGTGIAPDEMPRLFERFFRSESVRKTSTHGSGLGLAISRDIVRSHGGEITLQSEQGVGTTVVVRLPARRRTPATSIGAP
ncbi:cell wall metabolism sensor histidine kinase WalK [Microbacterium sp. SLBN-146]|uniref:sensor histidine kinase n=1 Tax=Microbacterium sp. SLBN-146 TaxID=2768457 RepID=UPI0011547156|nr:PAS domain-containing sensor histidine kinase [Microbacterium sp. SLBN-146]TQJ32328.1 phospho-acceptor domain-containing protein [Microbacterium sp. SLBN-146]